MYFRASGTIKSESVKVDDRFPKKEWYIALYEYHKFKKHLLVYKVLKVGTNKPLNNRVFIVYKYNTSKR